MASWMNFRASYISTLNEAGANQAPMRYASADPIHRRNGRTFCGDITSDLSQDSSNTRHPEQGRFPSPNERKEEEKKKKKIEITVSWQQPRLIS